MTRWIPVLVRLEDYADIAAVVAERESKRPAEAAQTAPHIEVTARTATADPASSAVLEAHVPWERDDLSRVAQGLTITTQRWTAALDECAKVPGQWLTTSEVAKRTGLRVNEWRDASRKLPRHLKTHYPTVPVGADGRSEGPLAVWTAPRAQEVSWAITPEMARRWAQVRDQ